MPRNRKAHDQKRKMKQKRKQCFKRQEEKGYIYIDLWNEDIEAEELEDENREKVDKPLVEDNQEDLIREEKPEDENDEEFPV